MVCPVCGYLVGGHKFKRITRNKTGKIICLLYRCSGETVIIKKEKEWIQMKINIAELILEIVVGRLVLQLPNEDLEKINKMIINSLEKKKEWIQMIDTAKWLRQIETLIILSEINIAILEIVTEEHPKIFRKAILQVIDKYPELSKKGKDEKW